MFIQIESAADRLQGRQRREVAIAAALDDKTSAELLQGGERGQIVLRVFVRDDR